MSDFQQRDRQQESLARPRAEDYLDGIRQSNPPRGYFLHFTEYHATMGGIYKSESSCHSQCVCSHLILKNSLQPMTAKFPLMTESSASIKDRARCILII